jgi:cytochrome c oxidase assembly factor CtaG
MPIRSPSSALPLRRWPLYLLVTLTALLPTAVSAHGGGGTAIFQFNPLIWLGLILIGAAYFYATGIIEQRDPEAVMSRQLWFFLAGLFVIFAALQSPIDIYADNAFWVHMIQHLLLILAAPPLLLLGMPAAFFHPLTKRPALLAVMRVLVHPGFAWLISTGTFLIWHIPALYNAAVLDARIHALEHLSFLFTALLFWWPIFSPVPELPRLSRANQVLYLALTCQPNVVLGAVLVFAPHAYYGVYAGALQLKNINPLADQQIGGAIMWVPGNMVYLAVMSKLFFDWFNERESVAAEQEIGGAEFESPSPRMRPDSGQEPVPSNPEPRTSNSSLG